jgi:integrase
MMRKPASRKVVGLQVGNVGGRPWSPRQTRVSREPTYAFTRAKEAPGRVRYLSPEERDKLLNDAVMTIKAKDGRTSTAPRVPKPTLPLYILAALRTGARRGELLALRWADVDMKARMLTFRQTKNGDSRMVPITHTLREALQALLGL